MKQPYLFIRRLMRRVAISEGIEELNFKSGVNLIVGPPNTGKSKWIETLDYILGDNGEYPFANAEDSGLADKYDTAKAELLIGDEELVLERRWKEKGAKTKVFVNNDPFSTSDFQQFLMEKLQIPILHYPKGNPMSGQTWPELSFRSVLRHIYRQQRFWGGIADKQPESEQHASILLFLGLAEYIFSDEYGYLVKKKRRVERLKARREQYVQTLNELARDIVSDQNISVSVTESTVQHALEQIQSQTKSFMKKREQIIEKARKATVDPTRQQRVLQLGEDRAILVSNLEMLKENYHETIDRIHDIQQYLVDLNLELDRLARARDAGSILADLKITHCPACDQPVNNSRVNSSSCFLCHQGLLNKPQSDEFGALRINFELERLSSEKKEAMELVEILGQQRLRQEKDMTLTEEQFQSINNELSLEKQAISALVQNEISSIDMELGKLNERQRQLGRVLAAVKQGKNLTRQIYEIEREIDPLQERVTELKRSIDFDSAAELLEEGMNDYLNAINNIKSDVWPFSPIVVDVSSSRIKMKVGKQKWESALGGTSRLYFLMAYHFGLLTLSNKSGCHYPGLSIIDIPGEFSGESVSDKEDFIVQPFIDLLNSDAYEGAQMIITGSAYTGLTNVNRIELNNIYVS